jgi:Fe(3+) dicitrate transport protein
MKSQIFLWAIILTGILIINIEGQNTETQTLTGKVVDQNGAVVVGADVTAQFEGVNYRKNVQTDEIGKFSFVDLPTGTFQISVSANGFGKETKTIRNGSTIEITLTPQNVAEVVSVTSNYLAGTSEALEQTPGSLQILDRQTLENARVFDFSEGLRKVSGVNVRDEEGFGLRPNIGIRGTNPTRSTKILLLEDGIPLAYAPYGDNASYYHPPIERFDSIEVLKGSGQIGYGPVTVAGVVNYLTPNPPEKPTFSLKLIGGNRDFFNGNANFGTTFGKTGMFVNFNRKQGEGARENVRSGLNDLSTKIVQRLDDRNILTIKYSHFNEDSRLTYSGLTEAEYAANRRGNPFRNDSTNFFREGFSVAHTAVLTSRASLTTKAYTSYFSRDWWRQSSNSAQRPTRLNIDADCRLMADLNTTCGNEGRLRDYRVYGIEPRFDWQFDLGGGRSDFSAGFRYHYENQDRRQLNGDLPTSREGVLAESNVRRNTAVSGFLQNRFIFGDLAITPGVRIEKIKFERINRLTSASGETGLTQVIPGIGIAYNFKQKTTVFAGVHRGFAPPRTEDIISNSGGVVELDAELSWNYEIGVRSRIIKGVNLEATFFRNDYENQIVPASVAGGSGAVFTNGGRTLHQGIEFAGQFDSASVFNTGYNFYLRSSYTLLGTAEFRGIRNSSVGGFTNVSVTGNRLPYAPKHLLNAAVGFAYRNFDVFLENNYLGAQFGDDLNRVNPPANGQGGLIPSQIYFNTTANYKVEKWKTTFFVTAKNIFDRTFIVDRSRGILPSSPRLLQAGFKLNL